MTGPAWEVTRGNDPLLATAIHAGHDLRDEVASLMSLAEDDRLREEDPFTDQWVGVAANTITVNRSRFEVDLNRVRERAVYVDPEDAWGLTIWKSRPTDDLVAGSLALYDRFYAELGQILDELVEAHGRFVVLDLHSYNHRRNGPDAAVEDPELNPEVNLGTESIESDGWAGPVEDFAEALRSTPFYDDHLDVRFNVRFKGGAMPRWINARYGDRGCSIAIEMKKIFMDEWTGELYEGMAVSIGQALEAAAAELRERL